jgi:hypothetical protein
MDELEKFIEIVKKANKSPIHYSDEYWDEQNKQIGEIHKESHQRMIDETPTDEILTRPFDI